MRTSGLFMVATAGLLLCGCKKAPRGIPEQALVFSNGDVSIYQYHASRPVTSYSAEVDGKVVAHGSKTPAWQEVVLVIVDDGPRTLIQVGQMESGGKAGNLFTIHIPKWTVLAEPENVTIPQERLLTVKPRQYFGPTTIYQGVQTSKGGGPAISRTVRVTVE